jgi:L-asparaginase II
MNLPPAGSTEVLIEVTRGPEVESIHRGAVAVSDAQGRIVAFAGDPELPAFVRSAAKPFQAMSLFESEVMERAGLTDEELAIVISSHSGEPFHLRLVESVQRKTGVRADWLQCGVHPPFDPVARREMARAGVSATPMHNNCSGKHTGMLAVSLAIGGPIESYIDPDHPVQVGNRRRLAMLAGIPADAVGVAIDGCSAPAFRLPLGRFATAMARLTAAGAAGAVETAPGLAACWRAMVDHPDIIAGTRERLDTPLMSAAREAGLPLVAKAGAEGTYTIGVLTPDGPFGIALKVEDGGERGRNSVAIEALAQLGLLTESMTAAMRDYHRPRLRNFAGRDVGELRPRFTLRRR